MESYRRCPKWRYKIILQNGIKEKIKKTRFVQYHQNDRDVDHVAIASGYLFGDNCHLSVSVLCLEYTNINNEEIHSSATKKIDMVSLIKRM